MTKFRILSLDGGGPWALVQVKTLQKIYGDKTPGHKVLKDFHLVAANSGGSLTLAGLIENRPLDEILSDYFLNEKNRKSVFREVDLWPRIRDGAFYLLGIGPKYSTQAKLKALNRILSVNGNRLLSEIHEKIKQEEGSCPHFLVCAFDYDRKRAMFFRSQLDSKAQSSAKAPASSLIDAVHASSNAPITFFDEPAEAIERRFWDGAIAGHNNPVLVAVVEALAGGNRPEDIQILSIGTGSVRRPDPTKDVADPFGLVPKPKKIFFFRHARMIFSNIGELAGSILDDPPDVATFVAYVTLGQPLPTPGSVSEDPGSVVRMNPMIQPWLGDFKGKKAWLLPAKLDRKAFNDIADMPVDALEQRQVRKIAQMCDLWLDDDLPNQPIRTSSQDYRCEIGQPFFSKAHEAWVALTKTG